MSEQCWSYSAPDVQDLLASEKALQEENTKLRELVSMPLLKDRVAERDRALKAEAELADLKAQIENAPIVLRLKNGLIVSEDPVPGTKVTFAGEVVATHRGRLIAIEEIAK